MPKPLAYFITFSRYGSRLHGDEKGSVDRKRNQYGSDLIAPNRRLQQYENQLQKIPSFILEPEYREIVFKTIMEVCTYRHWRLYALHVRTNHVHVVVSTSAAPEKALHNFQAYATRHLREKQPALKDARIWTRHGSTKYLWELKSLIEAIGYVAHQQGEHMEYWYDKEFFDTHSSKP